METRVQRPCGLALVTALLVVGAVVRPDRPDAALAGKPLTLSTTSLTKGQVGKKYKGAVKAVGGNKPYAWSIESGELPAGLELNQATGKITGVPQEFGDFDLTFRVTDSTASETGTQLTLHVDLPAACPEADPSSAGTLFSKRWTRLPTIIVAAKAKDRRIAWTFEAVACWNHRLTAMGTPFRLGTIALTTEIVPAEFLVALSNAIINGGPRPEIPVSVAALDGDIIIAMSDVDFISFAAYFQSGERVLVGIKSLNISPLTLPNVPRNVIAHEIGHAIGLGHNDDPTKLMCGRPAECRPAAFESNTPEFFPLTTGEEALLLDIYPPEWAPAP